MLWQYWMSTVLLWAFSALATASAIGGPLLDNRFRLDHGIKEVSLIIYRDVGSEASILVQPDGSKLYVTEKYDNVNWMDDAEFDLITIRAPMPGPWQVIGNVDARNRWVVLSDVQLVLDTQPTRLFARERLKTTARIVNLGETVDLRPFLKDLKLEVWVRKAGTTDKYGLDYNALKIGEYQDDGTGLDERPGDGVFTANLDLQADPDQYQMIYRAFNPTFERTTEIALKLQQTPVQAEVLSEQGIPRAFYIRLDDSLLSPKGMTVTGDILTPDGRKLPFAARGNPLGEATYRFDYLTRGGEYGAELQVNTTDLNGLPRVFELAKLVFNIAEQAASPQEELHAVGGSSLPQRDENPLQAVLAELQAEFERRRDDLKQAQQPYQPAFSPLLVAAAFAVFLLLALMLGFVWFKLKKRKALMRVLAQKAALEAARNKRRGDNHSVDLTKPEG